MKRVEKNSDNYPDYVARFYDLVYSSLRSGTDMEYYLKQVLETDGAVLEVGVGTGRLFVAALDRGADIYGIDISGSMIEVLKKKIDREHHRRVSVQDAVELKLGRKFDLIIAPFRVFSHIMTVEDQLKALDNIEGHLEPGGRLIFDLFVPDLKVLIEGIDGQLDFEGEDERGRRLKRVTSMKTDLLRQVSRVNMKFTWQEGEKEIERDWNFQMRYYFRFELEHLVARSRLKLAHIFGDFLENRLDENSREFVVVCRKERER